MPTMQTKNSSYETGKQRKHIEWIGYEPGPGTGYCITLLSRRSSLREQAYLAFLKAGIEMPIRRTVVHTKADA